MNQNIFQTDVALVTIMHEPTDRLIEFLRRCGTQLKQIYPEMFVCISDQSYQQWTEEFKKYNFNVAVIPKNGAGDARRSVVNLALKSSCNYFHYCDSDRIFTWALYNFDELRKTILEILKYDYTILCRTKRAFATHPVEWQECEAISNKIMSLEFGQKTDCVAGSCGLSRSAAQAVLKYSTSSVTDCEWPMIINTLKDFKIGINEVEGLEYYDAINSVIEETPEQERWYYRLKLNCMAVDTAFAARNAIVEDLKEKV